MSHAFTARFRYVASWGPTHLHGAHQETTVTSCVLVDAAVVDALVESLLSRLELLLESYPLLVPVPVAGSLGGVQRMTGAGGW